MQTPAQTHRHSEKQAFRHTGIEREREKEKKHLQTHRIRQTNTKRQKKET